MPVRRRVAERRERRDRTISRRCRGRRGRCKPSSHRRKAAAIRAFYRFCFAEGLIERDVASLLDLPRASRQLPDTLDVARSRRSSKRRTRAPPLGSRDRALLELLYACGLRVSEALNLDMEDVSI